MNTGPQLSLSSSHSGCLPLLNPRVSPGCWASTRAAPPRGVAAQLLTPQVTSVTSQLKCQLLRVANCDPPGRRGQPPAQPPLIPLAMSSLYNTNLHICFNVFLSVSLVERTTCRGLMSGWIQGTDHSSAHSGFWVNTWISNDGREKKGMHVIHICI